MSKICKRCAHPYDEYTCPHCHSCQYCECCPCGLADCPQCENFKTRYVRDFIETACLTEEEAERKAQEIFEKTLQEAMDRVQKELGKEKQP